MTFADLTDFLGETDLNITLGEKTYTIAAPNAEDGIRLAALANLAVAARQGVAITEQQRRMLELDDEEERDFNRMILGGTLDVMIADGLNSVVISRVAQYAFTHFSISEEAAREAAAAGAFMGKAPAPTNRAARRKSPSTAARSDRPASAAGSRTKAPQGAASRTGSASSKRGRSSS